MIQRLENDLLIVEASTAGAELQSIRDKRSGHEYLWQGDPAFWKRRSPVLFPIVGAVWNGVFRIDGKEYPMGQHGFARDMEFSVIDSPADDEMWFRLESSPETLAKFPSPFRLDIGYRLYETQLIVMWRVENTGETDMSFQIGAHPAFNLPDFNPDDLIHGYFAFDNTDLHSETIESQGCVGERIRDIATDGELLPIDAGTFGEDALIFGGGAIHRVSLLDKERRPYVTVLTTAPYTGLWAPGPKAPFVCIEPWYGRADSCGFTGEFYRRTAVNTIKAGKRFDAHYMIIVDNI